MAHPSDHDIILSLGEDLPVGIWIARVPGGEEVYANRTFAQIMGTGLIEDTRAGAYAAPYGICTREGAPYPEERMPFVRALQERQVVVADDIMIRRRDGSCVDVRAFARPVADAAGVFTHVIIAFFDITREAAAEKARAESEHRLERAQRMEAIGTLAGGIAHDFNNLIFGIKLIAADLAPGEPAPARKQALAMIDELTERSATLTRSLLGFARRGKHRAMPVCLSDVVGSMVQLLRRTAAGIELQFDLAARDRGVVLGDQSQLEQVVMNLVGNARDAVGASGRIVLQTRTAETAPTAADAAAAAGPYVVLEVIDDGPGIPAALRERVFEPYFTTKLKGPDRGTGLGLATVAGIVELHGGVIEIDTGLGGRGTTMRVFLPAGLRAGVPAPPVAALVAQPGTGLVLIVDDDPIVRRALANALGGLGYETLEAASGAEALELFGAHGATILAVVLDMVMPVMGGRATYLGLRALDPDVRVLLMSGYADNDEVEAILGLGVRAFLAKPHSLEQLSAALATICA